MEASDLFFRIVTCTQVKRIIEKEKRLDGCESELAVNCKNGWSLSGVNDWRSLSLIFILKN